MTAKSENDQICLAAQMVYEASKPIRILSHISWPSNIREEFLAKNAEQLPQNITYPDFDKDVVLNQLKDAKKNILKLSPGAIQGWLLRVSEKLELTAHMLASCGTADFFNYSHQIYGQPTDVSDDNKSTPLFLAQQFTRLFDSIGDLDLGAPTDACHLATDLAQRMQAAVQVFGDKAPAINIVDELSANALAGPTQIRIRNKARFSDLDIEQLIHHEVMIHVATSLNGQGQTNIPLLGVSHAGTTKIQEGLAVFAEFITGTIDLNRFRRLADRVIAIQMAIDGADFIEVYKYFLGRTSDKEQSFENARRVFRGGVLTGKYPFTKDIVYLDGLLRVHNFLRVIITSHRPDCMPLLFTGKLDLEDLPAIAELKRLGLCSAPQFLPHWVQDARFLVSYLGYSAFLNSIDLHATRERLRSLINAIPT